MTVNPSLQTRAVHAGRADLGGLGVHALPLDLSTTYPLPDGDDGVAGGGDAYEHLATGGRARAGDSHVYARLWNPTVARFEDGLADLEQADGAVAFASGMAALTAVLLGLGEGLDADGPRPHVVAVRPLYGGTDHLLAAGLCGTAVTFTDPGLTATDVAAAVAAAARPQTRLVLLETPANPTLELVDIAGVVAAARRHCPGAVVMVDNTFATPVLQLPLVLGADLVLHSATKFIGGHGDAMGGVVAVGGAHAAGWVERLRRVRAITGALMHPLGAYLLHRGLATLPLRVAQQGENAHKVALGLAQHAAVEAVYYPGLDGRDPAGLVGTQMSGHGSVLALRVVGGFESACAVAGSVRLLTHAVSLGGVDTLVQHPSALTHRPVAGDAKPDAGLLRISVGLEDPNDVLADLYSALDGAAARTGQRG